MDAFLLPLIGATIPFPHVDASQVVHPLTLQYCLVIARLGAKSMTHEW